MSHGQGPVHLQTWPIFCLLSWPASCCLLQKRRLLKGEQVSWSERSKRLPELTPSALSPEHQTTARPALPWTGSASSPQPTALKITSARWAGTDCSPWQTLNFCYSIWATLIYLKIKNDWVYWFCAKLLLLTTKLPGVRFACKNNAEVLIKQKAHQQPGLDVRSVEMVKMEVGFLLVWKRCCALDGIGLVSVESKFSLQVWGLCGVWLTLLN